MTWATYVPILVFLGLSFLDLGPMYATDRRQTSDTHHRYPRDGGIIKQEAQRNRALAAPELGQRHAADVQYDQRHALHNALIVVSIVT